MIRMEEARRTALVVEDSFLLGRSYKRFLEAYGYQTEVAESAEDAEKYLDREFDLVIIDGLEGRCFDLFPKINARRKLILSGSEEILDEARKRDYLAYDKLGEQSMLEMLGEDEQ